MRLSPLLCSVPEEQSHSILSLLWHTVKRCSQVICSLYVIALYSVLSQKSSHLVCKWWLESVGLIAKSCSSGVGCLRTSFPDIKLHSVAPRRPFVFGEAHYTLPNVLQEGELLLGDPDDPLTMAHCARPTCFTLLLSLIFSTKSSLSFAVLQFFSHHSLSLIFPVISLQLCWLFS